jgi:hypothetical protein
VRNKNTAWLPTPLERKCLAQLDVVENWRILRRERPDNDELLSWTPFVPIFWFNLAVFAVAMSLALIGAAVGTGSELRDLFQSDNLVPGALLVAVVSILMASVATALYRRSWNRRARWLQSQMSR